MFVHFEYIGYRSQAKDAQVTPVQTTAKFSGKLYTQNL
jgi:hypothetical protein